MSYNHSIELSLIHIYRIHCKPEEYEMICKELYKTLSKYMAVAEDEMRIHITRSEIHIPVSYTHLDVYKRQDLYCPGFRPTMHLPCLKVLE